MYKVFSNDKLIILTEAFELEAMTKGVLYFQYHDFEEINFALTLLDDHEGLTGVIIQSPNIDELWADFRAHFYEIDAAGGLVQNEDGELLLIHRFGKWDLPKGKREEGEDIASCALREVQEECGIEQINLGTQLPDTYHIYTLKGMRHLKRTYWWEMHTSQRSLTPQAEEGITAAIWKNVSNIDWDTMPTYPNIRFLIDRVAEN